VPERVARGATIEIAGERRALERSDAGLVVESSKPPMIAARGAADVFKSLFAEPFGAKAFAAFQDTITSAPPQVYGVANEDVSRMNDFLWHAAESARTERKRQAFGFGAAALVYGTFGTFLAARGDLTATESLVIGGYGVPFAMFSAWSALRTSREKDAYAWFSRGRLRSSSTPDFMATAEARLFPLAKRDREERLAWRWIGIAYGSLTVAAVSLGVAGMASRGQEGGTVAMVSMTFLAGVAFAVPIIGTFTPTYTERMADIWARDPSRARIEARSRSDFSIRPIFGSTSFGVGGTF
jgi:hypothetical protein